MSAKASLSAPATWSQPGSRLSDAMKMAVTELIQDGIYKRILDKWGVGAVAETSPSIDAGKD
jgi:hypothetical protein